MIKSRNFFSKYKFGIFGLSFIAIMLLAAIFAPLIAPHDPYQIDLANQLSSPSNDYPLGRDQDGRDILSNIIYGTRISLRVSIFTVLISLVIGTFLGSLSGYYGGILDQVFMRIVDILQAFPGILLAISVSAVLGPSINNVIIALCIVGWVNYARLIRGQFLSLRERDYVVAAKALGAKDFKIVFAHMLPNSVAPLVVEATFGLASAILAEAALSFLGIGAPAGTPSWGLMINNGARYLLKASYLATFPGMAIMLAVLSFNFIGDSLRDYLDVKKH
jgi:peptide/nickel transport system permease protein